MPTAMPLVAEIVTSPARATTWSIARTPSCEILTFPLVVTALRLAAPDAASAGSTTFTASGFASVPRPVPADNTTRRPPMTPLPSSVIAPPDVTVVVPDVFSKAPIVTFPPPFETTFIVAALAPKNSMPMSLCAEMSCVLSVVSSLTR